MTFKLWPPKPDIVSYWRLSWLAADGEYPVTIWYEVTPDGSVTRLIDIYRDGGTRRDSLDNYPDGASDFGFGTLIGEDFFVLDWQINGGDEDDPVFMTPASKAEFDAVWETS